MDKKRIELLKMAIKDWQSGKLSDGAAMCVVTDIVDLQKPDKAAFEWAKKEITRLKKEN